MKKSELKTKTKSELQNILKKEVKKLHDLKFDLSFSRLKDVSSIKKTKRNIARIKTLLNQE